MGGMGTFMGMSTHKVQKHQTPTTNIQPAVLYHCNFTKIAKELQVDVLPATVRVIPRLEGLIMNHTVSAPICISRINHTSKLWVFNSLKQLGVPTNPTMGKQLCVRNPRCWCQFHSQDCNSWESDGDSGHFETSWMQHLLFYCGKYELKTMENKCCNSERVSDLFRQQVLRNHNIITWISSLYWVYTGHNIYEHDKYEKTNECNEWLCLMLFIFVPS